MSSTSVWGWAWGESEGRDVDVLEVLDVWLHLMTPSTGGRKWSRPSVCEKRNESSCHRAKESRSRIMHQDETCGTRNPTVPDQILRVSDPTV